MGLFDSLFGGSESEDPVMLEAYPGASEHLRQIGEASTPVGLEAIGMAGQDIGQLLAPLSQFQTQALGNIGNVLGRQFATDSPLFKQAQQSISGALEGFDPFKDARFKALRTNLERELKRAKDRIAARSSAGDEFFGGGRRAEERKAEEHAFGQMADVAGYLEGESRRNQLIASPIAQQFATLSAEEPRSRIMDALFGLGAAPRGFEQEEINARNADRLRRLQEMSNIGLNTALQASTFKPDWYAPSFGPSGFSQLASAFGDLGGLEGLFGEGTTLQGLLGGLFGGGNSGIQDPVSQGIWGATLGGLF